MHTLPPDAPRLLPAAVLAFALLGAFAAGGWQVLELVRTAPATPVPAQALGDTHTAAPTPTRRRAAPAAPTAAVSREDGPAWSTLTTPQKEALYPLAERWTSLSETQKVHWLNLAHNFKSLSATEQQKLIARITDWASLSTQQRSQARLNYAAATRVPLDNRKAQWEAYQALSAEEKNSLAAKAAPKPAGAAIALRPVPPKKLAKVPAATAPRSSVPANLPKIPPVTDFHVTQALPVLVPEVPVVVETAPIAAPVAVPAPLPLLDAPQPSPAAPANDADAPVHQPQ